MRGGSKDVKTPCRSGILILEQSTEYLEESKPVQNGFLVLKRINRARSNPCKANPCEVDPHKAGEY